MSALMNPPPGEHPLHAPTPTDAAAGQATHTLRLVLGDQLNPQHRWFAAVSPGVVYVLMEIRQETDYVLHHAQKIIALFAAMRALADQLQAAGHRVHYLRIDDPANRQNLGDNLRTLIAHYRPQVFEYQDPDEFRVDQNLQAFLALFRFGWSATVQKIVLTPLEQEPFRCKKHYFAKR